LSQDFSRQLKDDTNLLKQSNNSSALGKPDGGGVEEGAVHSLHEKSPLHVLLYGRSNHKLDSYSVLNAQNQVTIHFSI
jgi:hypothetical protein